MEQRDERSNIELFEGLHIPGQQLLLRLNVHAAELIRAKLRPVHRLSGSLQGAVHRCRRHRQRFRDLLGGPFKYILQNEYRALPRRQALQESYEAQLKGISADEPILRITSKVGRRPDPGRVRQSVARRSDGDGRVEQVNGKRAAFGLSQLVQAQVGGNPIDPSFEGRILSERAPTLPYPNTRLLNGIVRIVHGAQHSVTERG
ncbi:hypothetical protein D3C81_1259810 [compost metagenome]